MSDSLWTPGNPTEPPPPSENYQDRFLAELEAIKANTEAMHKFDPKEIVKALQDQAASHTTYANAGPSQGQAAAPAFSGTSGASSLGGTSDATARAQLFRDPTEASVDGSEWSNMGGESWQSRVAPGGLGQVVPMPRFPGAQPNVRDYLNYLSTVSANVAWKRTAGARAQARQTQQNRLQELVDNGTIPEGAVTIDQTGTAQGEGIPQPTLDEITQQGEYGGGAFGKLSNIFSSLETGYAQGRYIKNIFSGIARPVGQGMQLGYQTGYEGGNIFGFSPGALFSGLGQRASAFGFSLNNSLSPGQGETIYQNLFGQGWLGGPKTDAMRNAAAQIMHTNSYIGSMPQTYEMMDQATRMGVTSLSQFVETMSQVPDAAKAAHTSIVQTMSDFNQLGQLSKKQGGTYQAGLSLGAAWQSITGLPGASLAPLLQTPMVQAQTFMDTGLMPFEQGMAPPGSRINSLMTLVNRLHGTILGRPGLTQHLWGGFTQTTSTEDQKFATMAMLMGGATDASTLKNLFAHQQGIRVGANLWDSLSAWNNEVDHAAAHDPKKLQHLLSTAPGGGDWGKLLQGLNQAYFINAQGHAEKMFSGKQITSLEGIRAHDIKQWNESTYAGHKSHGGYTYGFRGPHVGSLETWTSHPAASTAQGAQLPGALAKKIAHDREWQVKQWMGKNTGQQSGQSITISLSKAAQKMFKLSDPAGASKANANAGTINVNMNPYVGQGSTPPAPDLSTASNWTMDGTNPSGSGM